MHLPPLLALHLAVLLFGGAGLFGKWIELPPTLIVLGRVVFASIVLAGVVALRRRDPAPDRVHRTTDRSPVLLRPALGLLLAVHWVTFFQAVQVSTVAVALLTFATFPVFTAVLEPFLPGERFDPVALGASAVALAGIALVVPSTDLSHPTTQGALWGVASGFTFALLSLANRGLVRRWGAVRLALRQDLWAAFFLLPFLLTSSRAPTATEWALLVVLGTVFTAGAHALFIHGLSGVRAGRASVIASLEPVYGVVLAAALLGERPGARVMVGGVVVLLAAWWVSRPDEADPGRVSPETAEAPRRS